MPLVPHCIAVQLREVEQARDATGIASLYDSILLRGGGCTVDVSLLAGNDAALCATSINGIFAVVSKELPGAIPTTTAYRPVDFQSHVPVELVSMEEVLEQVLKLLPDSEGYTSIDDIRSHVQVASMAVDKARGYLVLVTTMLTAHVFALHDVDATSLRQASSAA